MDYTNELQSTISEITDRLNDISRPLWEANIEPTESSQLAIEGFQQAIFHAKMFVMFDRNDSAEAALVKARLRATGDILEDAILAHRADLGL